MSDNSDNNSSGLSGLILLGLLGYAAYKSLKSSSNNNDKPSKKSLSSYNIESIVDVQFRYIDDEELAMTCFSFFVPDFTGIKKNHYDEMLLRRLNHINKHILSMVQSGYEAYNPNIDENHMKDLLSFIRNDCYEEIKATKFISQLKGKVMSFVPGMNLMGKIQSANIDYKVITAIRKGLKDFFTALYLYGRSIDEAKRQFKHKYVYAFCDSIS